MKKNNSKAIAECTPDKKMELTEKTALLIIVSIALLFFLPFLLSNKMIYGSDALGGIYARYFYADFFGKYHSFPRVLSVTLSGMPTLEAFMGDFFYPLIVFQFIFDVPRSLGYKFLITVICAGVFAWLFFYRALKLRKDISLLGAIAFAFNTQFISHFFPGHDGKMFVISWLPLSLFAVKRLCDTRRPPYVIILAFSIGMCLLSSHVQTTYFSLWGIGLYFLYETISLYRLNRLKKLFTIKVALFTFAVTLGLGIGMVQLLPPYKFTKQYSVRSTGEKTTYEHATSWSIHWEEVASFIVPEFCGFADKDGEQKTEYWGRNPFKLNSEYAGIVILVFALFGIVAYRKDPLIRFWAFMGGGALIFSLGANTPFFHLFYNLVPGVKLFRAPSMILFWFSMAAVVITVYTINKLLYGDKITAQQKELWARRIMWSLAVCGALTIVVTISESTVFTFWRSVFYSDIDNQKVAAFGKNYGAFIKGAWFALLFGGSALLLLYAYLKDMVSSKIFIAVLIVVCAADLFRVNSYFFKLINPSDYISRNEPALIELNRKTRNDYFRVLPVPGHLGNGDPQLYGLDNVLGFHDNELSWYREFTGGQQRNNLFYRLQTGRVDSNPFLDMLNVKYILYRASNNGPIQIAYNPTAMPRAFTVPFFIVMNPDAIPEKMKEEGFPYRNTVILEKQPSGITMDQTDTTAPGSVSYKIEQENRIIDANMQRGGFVVISDIYMPYWQATIDGKLTEIHQANRALMAVYVPAGEHQIVISYHSPNIRMGMVITFVAMLVCILVLVADRIVLKKRNIRTEDS